MWKSSTTRLIVRLLLLTVFILIAMHLLNFLIRHSKQTSDMLPTNLENYDHFQVPYNSTCSRAADKRGDNQKIISFSLYGNFTNENMFYTYLQPLKDTINLIAQIYPGWVVRIYHNMTIDDAGSATWHLLVKTLPVDSNHVDLCNATEIIKKMRLGDIFAMTWRWLPLLDDMVQTLMSRDTDGRIIPREKEAVSEWLSSDRIFHVMRDHPAHCLFGFIMGCCWGVKVSMDRPRIVHSAKMMFTINHMHEYDYDQLLLDEFIWPIARTNLMAHDSYCCEVFQQSQPFPTQRKDRFFVGSRTIMGNGKNGTEELSDIDICPHNCRPHNASFKSDWKFC
ncbi:uncharacterized protein LOC124200464 [Daphnia pulex]|uniref:uncharacterized protein LOC124200464 n=1 Tax=Daphnia pulex TaxID=6669 RepID=UPI001EDD5CDD|nr:uncharacterized protein LOC124200464 [Daphnia pulex]